MAIKYVNTDELNNISKELLDLTKEFEECINDFYKRLSLVPDTTNEWSGNQANIYFNEIAKDKDNYLKFASKLKDLGNKIASDSININNTIISAINDERG